MLLNCVIYAIYSFAYLVLGSIVLALVPVLRVTVVNLIVFALGAFAGAVSVLYANNTCVLQRLFGNYVVFVLVYFGAATLGGTIAVGLKMRFVKTSSISRIL
jgi:hypothetical protein